VSDLLHLADRALRLAEGSGDEVQVTVTRERSLHERFARSAPTQATSVEDETVHVLCLRDGRPGGAETNLLDDDALRAVAARAGAAAAAAAQRPDAAPAHPGLPGPAAYRAHAGHDPATAHLDPATAGDALRSVFAVAQEHGAEAFGIWTAGEVSTAIASSAGVRAADAVTDVFLKVVCRDRGGRTGFASGTAVAARDVDPAAVARRAAAKLPRGPLAELAPGTYPVVLDADAVGLLLGFLGDLAFNGLAHAEGRGALAGLLGTKVAAPAINLSDSPRFVGTLPRAFDAEGVPKAPLPLVQDGVAHRVVHDTRSAARAGEGASTTGHALAPGGSPGGPQPTNLVLVGGGAADEHELARPIERGLYVNRLWYVNAVHEKATLLTGVTRDGTHLIEDGEITRPVRDVRFTDTALGVLARTQALGARPRLVSEGEHYGRRFATGTVCPPLRCGALRITGGSPARG